MGLFSKKPKRGAAAATEAWSVEKWQGLVKSVSMSAEMYCEKYDAEIASNRASAAALLADGAEERARSAAEMALRNRAKVRALSRLTVLAAQLHTRSSRIAALQTLQDVREPARTELVSLVYASTRLNVQPLSEVVALLRTRFPDDVDDIVNSRGNWAPFFDTRLYDALTPGPADADLVDAELTAAAKEFLPHPRNAPAVPNGAQLTSYPAASPADAPQQGARIANRGPPSPTALVAAARAHAQLGAQPLHPPPTRLFAPGAPVSIFGVDGQLPRPWDARGRPRAPIGVRGAALPPSPPPPPGSAAERVPDYALRFTDSDEVVLMRYRDLLKA